MEKYNRRVEVVKFVDPDGQKDENEALDSERGLYSEGIRKIRKGLYKPALTY